MTPSVLLLFAKISFLRMSAACAVGVSRGATHALALAVGIAGRRRSIRVARSATTRSTRAIYIRVASRATATARIIVTTGGQQHSSHCKNQCLFHNILFGIELLKMLCHVYQRSLSALYGLVLYGFAGFCILRIRRGNTGLVDIILQGAEVYFQQVKSSQWL
jgi:hypothetical protein